MHGAYATVKSPSRCHHTVEEVLEKLAALVRSGIAHGYFEITVAGADGKAGATEVIITAGKKFRFVVPKE
ncbi:MAG: hypothetical protein ACE141_14045 [Bryobacteraceae bacterium]